MQLANFGVIRMDGKAKRPQPGANFNQYQSILANTLAMQHMQQRVMSRRQRSPEVASDAIAAIEPDHL